MGKLEFSKVIQPAIGLAENGYILTGEQARSLNVNRENFIGKNLNRPAFVRDTNGRRETP